MKLHTLSAPKTNKKTPKRVGRGEGSGLGQQSGRGHKGQKSISGYSRKRGFEGGQMPLQRRIPKFGFKNPFRVEYKAVNLDMIQKLVDENEISGEINPEVLREAGLVPKKALVKILGRGDIKAKVDIKANAFSKTAIQKIEQAGGSATTV